jgi:hypothetical protein
LEVGVKKVRGKRIGLKELEQTMNVSVVESRK